VLLSYEPAYLWRKKLLYTEGREGPTTRLRRKKSSAKKDQKKEV